MNKDEALKLALEALENSEKLFGDPEDRLMTDFDLLQNAITAIREALAEQPAQPIRWDSNAVDMTGAMATLPKAGSESVVDYKPVMSDVGADANIPSIPGTYYGIVPKGTGKITVTNGVQRKPWVSLTEQEIEKLAVESGKATFLNDDEQTDILWFDGDCFGLARAIEAKLREKNA